VTGDFPDHEQKHPLKQRRLEWGTRQYYRHSDWLGTNRFSATPSGTVYFDGAYAPYAENYAGIGTSDRVFTGQPMGTLPGLYDFTFREYGQAQGRWLVPDPAGLVAVDITNPQTWNRYAYVVNNPLNAVDPLGLYCAINPDGGTFRGCTQGAAGYGWGGGDHHRDLGRVWRNRWWRGWQPSVVRWRQRKQSLHQPNSYRQWK